MTMLQNVPKVVTVRVETPANLLMLMQLTQDVMAFSNSCEL